MLEDIKHSKIVIDVYDLRTGKTSSLSWGEKFSRPTVLCLGSFDGVHSAHKALIAKTLEITEKLSKTKEDIASGAWFFSHATKKYLNETGCAELTTLEEKLCILKECGLEFAFVADFPSVKEVHPQSFIEGILIDMCDCRFAVCGYDFKFGKYGSGNAEILKIGFKGHSETVKCIKSGDLPTSSTYIRDFLYRGEAEKANQMLGYPYFVSAHVVHGKQLGRKLGFPTANIVFPSGKLIPQHGVYATLVKIEGIEKAYIGVSNVGSNPTVSDLGEVTCETYILDFSQDIYGKAIRVEFFKKLRDEQKFPSLEALTEAISKNADQARALLSKHI